MVAGRLSITFDDGLASVYSLAYPEMERFGVSGTVFAVSDLVGRQFLGHQLMNQRMLRELCSAGWEIGSHTKTHPRLPDLSSHQANDELRLSKEHLEHLTGRRVTTLAYPYGASGVDGRIVSIATRHYLYARTLSCYPPLTLNQIVPSNRMRLNAIGSLETAFALPWHLYSVYAPTIVKRTVRKLLFDRSLNVPTGVGGGRTSLNSRMVAKWIHKKLKKSLWLILCFHNLTRERTSTSYDISIGEFRQIVKAAAAVSEVITIRDALKHAQMESSSSATTLTKGTEQEG